MKNKYWIHTIFYISLIALGIFALNHKRDFQILVAEESSSGESSVEEPSSDLIEKELIVEEPIEEVTDVLVVYFSITNTTKGVAQIIAEKVEGDLFRIEPITPYTLDDKELHKIALAELRNGERPPILDTIDNLAQYETIFLGYPIWWYDMPAILYSFLDQYALDGKTILPFATSTYTGLEDTVTQIQYEEPHTTVKGGLILTDATLSNADSLIDQWLANQYEDGVDEGGVDDETH